MAKFLLPEMVKKPASPTARGVLWPVFQLASKSDMYVATHARHMEAKFPALTSLIQV
jgi:hypothetical protein